MFATGVSREHIEKIGVMRTLFAILMAVLIGFSAKPVTSGAGYPPHVLVLFSYDANLSWSQELLDGIRDGLQESGQPYELILEYMDATP